MELNKPIPNKDHMAKLPLENIAIRRSITFTRAKTDKVRAGADLPIKKASKFRTIKIINPLICPKLKSTMLKIRRKTSTDIPNIKETFLIDDKVGCKDTEPKKRPIIAPPQYKAR